MAELANADDPNMDDQPKTRLNCRRCTARMKLARQLPWLDHRLPAVLLFQCIDCGHVEDRDDAAQWRVEYFDDDGGCYVTVFADPKAEQRARDYFHALKFGRLRTVRA